IRCCKKSTNVSCRYGEIKRLTRRLECIHADQFSVVRQEWSARVSWVDRGLRLNDVRAVLDLGFGFPGITITNLADNTFGVRPGFPCRMTNCVDVCTNGDILCISQLDRSGSVRG